MARHAFVVVSGPLAAFAILAASACSGGDETRTCQPPCAAASCALDAGAYVARPAERCVDGACVADAAVPCGVYTCSGGGAAGDRCATTCDGEDDAKCIPSAHCDASACVPDLANGSACDEPSDCASGHCQNGFCCDAGDCCAHATECPTYGTSAPICEDASTCQGSRGEPDCVAFSCTAPSGVPDDSACTAATVASDCGPYPSVPCSGAAEQSAPACATSCATHADCDADAFCDPASLSCKADLEDGQPCDQDAARCRSGHCHNGFCCASGDCCATAADCPASYSTAPVCSSPATCQGTKDAATCAASQCGTAAGFDDDSACTAAVEASGCGAYPAVACNGAADQPPPACASACGTDADCDADAYCDGAGTCRADEPDGGACLADAQCAGGRCANGHCCASGDCCAAPLDCAAQAAPPVCDSAATCQGHRVDGVCTSAFACAAQSVPDGSGCAGLEANGCGMYPAVLCTAAQDQPAEQAALCATTCTGDGGCDVTAHCASNACVADAGQGGYCTSQAGCGAGLFCVDDVCCSSACTGTCQACDVPGHEGTCWNVPDGQDPDQECGVVSCAAYYWGWSGDVCYRKADLTAAEATCGGDGACRTAAEECGPRTVPGPAALTCNALCQDPAAGTCAGTTAGSCTNVNPGTQTCGSGRCAVTVARCASGAPIACVPNWGAATTETCNYVDDDCDGVVDDGFNLSTDVANCGACGAACTNAHGSTACSGGNCQPTCAAGWGSCDSNARNGCEFPFNDDPACASSVVAIGGVSGDTGADVLNRSGSNEEWLSFQVREDSGLWSEVTATVELYNPAGVDFDLCLYCYACGGTPIGCSTAGAGATDVVSFRREEHALASDTSTVVAEVKFYSGSVCAPWSLRVVGNTSVAAATCQ